MPINFGIGDSREDWSVAVAVQQAACAYSFRLLNPNYGGSCFIARRSSDSTERTIGFSSGFADWADLETWAGSDTVFVKTWFDQSGNGRDVTQTTNGNQPVIYTAGVREELNATPAIYFSGSTKFLSRNSDFMEGVYYAFSSVASCNDLTTSRWYIGTSGSPSDNNSLQIGFNGANAWKIAQWNNDASFTPTWTTSTAYVWAGKKNTPAGSTLWRDGTLISTQTQPSATQIGANATTFYIGAGGSPSYLNGKIGEVVVWNYAISSSQILVVSADMKTAYGI